MTRKVLWQVCLGLLCTAAMAMVVQAAIGPRQSNNGNSKSTVASSQKMASVSTSNVRPAAETPLTQQKQVSQSRSLKDLSGLATRPVTIRDAELAMSPKGRLAADAYARWQATGTATAEEKSLIDDYYFRHNNVESRNPLDAQGGPDAFGYRYVDNTGGDSATFSWIELCGDPNAIDGPTGDDNAVSIPFGWNFPFYGGSYNSVYVSTNGLLQFSAGNASFTNVCPYATGAPTNPQIAPYWDDLYASSGGGCANNGAAPWIRYRDFGTHFVVEWSQIPHFSNSADRYTFEAILYPDGKVKTQYLTITAPANPNSASIGIDAPGGGNGLEYGTCNVSTLPSGTANLAIWFYPGPQLPGRCCYNSGANCADNLPADCAALGGTWSGGLTCAGNPCPLVPLNDNCQNAIVIPSFPYTDTNDNTLATEDCALLSGGLYRETWYTFTTPGNCDITIDYCGTSPAFYNAYIVLEPSCPCTGAWTYASTWNQTDCPDGNWSLIWYGLAAGTYYWPLLTDNVGGYAEGPYTVNFTCTIQPVGRCCYGNPQTPSCSDVTENGCSSLGGVWDGTLNCTNNPCPPCDVTSTGTPEGEDCADPDDYNGGCNSTPQVFQDIPCDAHIAGTSYFDGSFRDTDWYQVTTLIPNDFTMTVTAEFDLQILIITPSPDCSNFSYIVGLGGGCQTVTLNSGPVPAGTYWFWVGPQFTNVFTCGEYDFVLTASAGCTCDPATDLTVLRQPGLGNGVNLRWYASQTIGLYRVFGTTEKNNDGDPDNGADPQWSFVTELPAPASPGYMTTAHTPLVPYANYVVVHDCAPRGRCCYGDPQAPNCQSPVTEAECDALSGRFDAGLNCTDNPCPIRPANDDCQNAIVVPSLPFTHSGDNTNATEDCPALSGGTWAETWYTFTTTQTCNFAIDYCGTTGFTDAYIVLDQSCPCSGAFIFWDSGNQTECGDGNWTIHWDNLPAGTYYWPVLTAPGSMGPYTVTFTCTPPPPPPANDNCANAIPVTNGVQVTGSTQGATTDGTWPCAVGGSELWYTYTSTANSTVTVSLCGSSYDSAVMVLASCGGANLACDDDACGNLTSLTSFAATNGATYRIAVGGFAGGTGNFSLLVTQ